MEKVESFDGVRGADREGGPLEAVVTSPYVEAGGERLFESANSRFEEFVKLVFVTETSNGRKYGEFGNVVWVKIAMTAMT